MLLSRVIVALRAASCASAALSRAALASFTADFASRSAACLASTSDCDCAIAAPPAAPNAIVIAIASVVILLFIVTSSFFGNPWTLIR